MRKLTSMESANLTKPGHGGTTEVVSFTVYGADQVRVVDFIWNPEAPTEYAMSVMSQGTATRAEARAAWKACLARGYSVAA